jgi:RNA polymerase sigma-70 factor (TIGR02960 family)
VTSELLERARAGDRDAFAELVQPHRRELQVHCYRMLGSLQDAEDVLQESLLAAWLGLEGFEGRSSVRTWLYRIATNRCLNHLRSAKRRPVSAVPLPVMPPEPTRVGEVFWLQPYPDALLDGMPDTSPGPETRYESREAISLAFVTAVQMLPPNQRAVLLLRDVLGYRAGEVGDLLGLTTQAVTSGLKRARATMANAHQPAAQPPEVGSREERHMLDRFVTAFTDFNVDELISIMTEDVWIRMPPAPFEYRGIEAAHRFLTAIQMQRRSVDCMVPIRANGQPGWGDYRRDPFTGLLHLSGLEVIGITGDRVCEITHFENTVAAYFGLPYILGSEV